jgi:hypothetical protein
MRQAGLPARRQPILHDGRKYSIALLDTIVTADLY